MVLRILVGVLAWLMKSWYRLDPVPSVVAAIFPGQAPDDSLKLLASGLASLEWRRFFCG